MSPRKFLRVGPLLLAITCATTPPNPNAAKYPRRPLNCKVMVFHTPAPEVKEWDDLGIARVQCPLDVGAVQCLQQLRSEVCRMGGDLVYDVPKKPLRPSEQGMVYMGHAGHTKGKPEDTGKDEDADAGVPDQNQGFNASGPVEPIRPAEATSLDAGSADGAR